MFIFRFLILTSQDATNSVTVHLDEILLITTDDSMPGYDKRLNTN